MKLTICIIAVMALTGCTWISYSSETISLTALDFHPSGDSISLDGVLQDKATLSVNRDQGSSADIIETVADAAKTAINPIGVIVSE
tara:strand:- start:103 stop:360 length:258 start_codon:yes stop_codon:yes gene_type:complete